MRRLNRRGKVQGSRRGGSGNRSRFRKLMLEQCEDRRLFAVNAFDDSYQTAVNNSLWVNSPGILANDQRDELEPYAIFLDNPVHGSLSPNSDGSFNYTPDWDFKGRDSFVYRAIDGYTWDEATVRITVDGRPQPIED